MKILKNKKAQQWWIGVAIGLLLLGIIFYAILRATQSGNFNFSELISKLSFFG